MNRKIELLSPAGSMDKLKVSLRYGADAVYIGGKAFNLRAKSSNFSNAALAEAVTYAHALGKRVYVTLNILAHDREIRALPKFVAHLEQIGVDAVIVADLGVIDIVQENSSLPIHISTQASTTNWRTVRMWQRLGAKRVVLAREVSLDEIKRIKDQVPEMELEVFVHGAMCMTYSGRCNLSRYFTERDGNRGACTNSCRWKYAVVEEKRPGEYFPVYEDETGTYMYNSKDLCTIDFLDKILDAGVDGLKIEGRMKSHYYCANATSVYRAAVDSYLSGNYNYNPEWYAQLAQMSHRGYTSGFFLGGLDRDSEQIKGGRYGSHSFAGLVRGVDAANAQQCTIEVREKFHLSDELQLLRPGKPPQGVRLSSLIDARTGHAIEVAQPNITVHAQLDADVSELDVLAVAGLESPPTAEAMAASPCSA